MPAIHFNDNNFEKEVIGASAPVMVDFYATWCGPCRMMSPIIDELADEYAGKIKIGKLDVDESPQVSMKFGIQSIPTLIFFKDGQAMDTVIGFQSKDQIKTKLEALIK